MTPPSTTRRSSSARSTTTRHAHALAAERGWVVKPDGEHWRRVVPSPEPKQIIQLGAIQRLVDGGFLVVCVGGGGVPVVAVDGGHAGVEAVIDKDLASALLATGLGADVLVLATDVDAVYTGWGTPRPARGRPRHPHMAARAGLRRRLDGARRSRPSAASSRRLAGERRSGRSRRSRSSSPARAARRSTAPRRPSSSAPERPPPRPLGRGGGDESRRSVARRRAPGWQPGRRAPACGR